MHTLKLEVMSNVEKFKIVGVLLNGTLYTMNGLKL